MPNEVSSPKDSKVFTQSPPIVEKQTVHITLRPVKEKETG